MGFQTGCAKRRASARSIEILLKDFYPPPDNLTRITTRTIEYLTITSRLSLDSIEIMSREHVDKIMRTSR